MRRAGRAMTRPTAKARRADSARARVLGFHPSSVATWRMRARVASPPPGRPLSANETAPFDTPARRATSSIVGERVITPSWPVATRWRIHGPAPRRSCHDQKAATGPTTTAPLRETWDGAEPAPVPLQGGTGVLDQLGELGLEPLAGDGRTRLGAG